MASSPHNGNHLRTIHSAQPLSDPLAEAESTASPTESSIPAAAQQNKARTRTDTTSTAVSAAGGLIRRASEVMMNADPPLGFMAALGSTTATAPSLSEIRRGSFSHDGWNEEKQVEHERRRKSSVSSQERAKMDRRTSSGYSSGRGKRTETGRPDHAFPESKESESHIIPAGAARGADVVKVDNAVMDKHSSIESSENKSDPQASDYPEAPKLPWTTTWAIGLRAFWKWFLTPLGFCITLYGLNVVAWGGMLFLLLCNAAPAMCRPTCNDINSPRRIWIEIDSQILNALFCVTGFGLIPWRFRDLYWLMVYRLGIRGRSKEQRMIGLRRLAGIYRGWFRLPDCDKPIGDSIGMDDERNPSLPLPLSKRLDAPLTGVRAPPTALWRMDFVIWCNVWNTFLQACLCGFMWGYNRYKRPSWSTGFFVAIACIVAGAGGIMMWVEGKKVKKVEGVPPKVLQRVGDAEMDALGRTDGKHAHHERLREVQSAG